MQPMKLRQAINQFLLLCRLCCRHWTRNIHCLHAVFMLYLKYPEADFILIFICINEKLGSKRLSLSNAITWASSKHADPKSGCRQSLPTFPRNHSLTVMLRCPWTRFPSSHCQNSPNPHITLGFVCAYEYVRAWVRMPRIKEKHLQLSVFILNAPTWWNRI